MLERLAVTSVLWCPEVCPNALLQVSAITAFRYAIFNGLLSDRLGDAQADLFYLLQRTTLLLYGLFLMDPTWNALTPNRILSSLFKACFITSIPMSLRGLKPQYCGRNRLF